MHTVDTHIFSNIGISLNTISHVRKLRLVRIECTNRKMIQSTSLYVVTNLSNNAREFNDESRCANNARQCVVPSAFIAIFSHLHKELHAPV